METQTTKQSKAVTVDPQDGENVSVLGDTYRIVTTGEQTGGAYATIEMFVPPNTGPVPHAHPAFREAYYVMEGEVVFTTETQTYSARKGSVVNIPQGGIVHRFKNESTTLARMLCVVVPAGLETFFQEIGTPVQAGTYLPPPPPMTPEEQQKMQEIAAKHGLKMYPPDFFGK